MKKTFALTLLGILCLVPKACFAQSLAVRQEIQAGYNRGADGSALKYAEGAISPRSYNFEAFDAEGHKLDLARELSDLTERFEQALSIREKIDIESMKMIDSKHLRCNIHDRMEFVMPASLPKVPFVNEINQWCVDEWTLEKEGWRQTRCRLIKVNAQSHPQIAADAK